MKKKLISLLTALCMTLVLFTGVPISVSAEGTNCTGDHTDTSVWTAISDASGFSNIQSGNYYLNSDITLTSEIPIGSGVDVTLCLNGRTITAANNKRIFYIRESGTFTLCDCKGNGKLIGSDISNNSDTNSGGVICSIGAFIMNGGTISGGKAMSGGGVSIGINGAFTMNGGTISGNEATDSGGGVHLNNGSYTFTMNGGTISNNTAAVDGSGVNITRNSTFTMTGGTITDNTSKGADGGAIWVSGGAAAVTLNGNVNITGNTKNDSASNVYLAGGKTLTIGNNFSTSSKVGVTASTTGDCENYVNVTETTLDVSSCFTSDNEKQSIVYNSSKVQLSGAHGTASYTPTNAATCTADGNVEYWTCPTCGKNYDSSAYTNALTTTVINALGHNYAGGKCTRCGEDDPNAGDDNNDDNNDDSISLKKDGNTLTISGTGAVNSGDLAAVTGKESITYVVIEGNITSVGDGAFDGFTNLETVTIPDSVVDIGENAFAGTGLDIVYYESGAGVENGDFPASATKIEYSVNGDGIVIENIILGDVISDSGKVEIPNSIGGKVVVEVAAEVRDKVSVEGHTAHNYENGVCTICGAADPNAGGGSQGTTPSNPSYPSVPSRPTTPSNPVVTPTVTTKTETTAKADEEIISDDTYTGEDISASAADDSDDGGIADMTVEVIALAVAAAVVCAVIIKKLIF